MGLDAIELVIRTEETFGILIEREDTADLTTLGDYYAMVLAKRRVAPDSPWATALGLTDDATCLTSSTFRTVRRIVTDELSIAERDIRPSTRLTDVIPLLHRRRVWRALQRLGKFGRLPDLRLPGRLHLGVPALFFQVWIAIFVSFVDWVPIEHALVLAFIPGAIAGIVCFRATRPLATEFPAGIETFADLTRAVLPPDCDRQALQQSNWTPEEVWLAVQRLTAEAFGVDIARITPHTRFVDLGA